MGLWGTSELEVWHVKQVRFGNLLLFRHTFVLRVTKWFRLCGAICDLLVMFGWHLGITSYHITTQMTLHLQFCREDNIRNTITKIILHLWDLQNNLQDFFIKIMKILSAWLNPQKLSTNICMLLLKSNKMLLQNSKKRSNIF